MNNSISAEAIKPKHAKITAIRLLAVFAALESFRLCYLRLCFWITEQTKLSELENMIFILFSFAVVAGMVITPLILDRVRALASLSRLSLTMRVVIASTAVAAVASYYTSGYFALALQFATTFFTACAMAICLRRITQVLISRRTGRFVGFATAIMSLSGTVLFYLPFVEIPTGVILIVMCGFLAIAAFCFHSGAPKQAMDAEDTMPIVPNAPLNKKVLLLFLLVFCLYALVGGLIDNIYFFDAAFDLIPNFLMYILLYGIMCNIAMAFIFERVNAAAAIICAFAMICVGQSMSFFSENTLLVYPYVLFSNAGNNMMEIYLITLPIAYCSHSQRKSGIIPGLGYILLYGSYFLTSVLFEFIPDSVYKQILGATLLISVASIVVTVYLMNENKAAYYNHLTSDLEEKLAVAQSGAASIHSEYVESLIKTYSFTNREIEVLRYLLEGLQNIEIADRMKITEHTVYKYTSSMFIKSGAKSRSGLIAMFATPKA